MVADRRLRDVTAGREVARADALATGELPEDREPGGVCRALHEEGVRVDESLHAKKVLTNVDIVKYQYGSNGRHTEEHHQMNATADLVAAIQGDRDRQIRHDRLAAIAARVRACCNPSAIQRAVRALRLATARLAAAR